MTAREGYDAYATTPEGAAYLNSSEFNERWQRLCDRFDAGETMTVAAAAEFVGVPIDVFRVLYGLAQMSAAIEMGVPPSMNRN